MLRVEQPAGGPKRYVALLTQSGTDAPVATVLENSLGEVPTYARGGLGSYELNTVAPLFVDGKVTIEFSQIQINGGDPLPVIAGVISATQGLLIRIGTLDASAMVVLADDVIPGAFPVMMSVSVYP